MPAQELNIDKIDTSNYYDYNAFNGRQKYLKGKRISETFLKKHEVLLIIKDELEKQKINDIQTHVIYELDSKESIVLDAYSPKENIGFIYIEIFNGVSKANRKLKSTYRRFFDIDYQETHYNINGTSKLIEIKTMPSNALILSADNYWFQFTEVKDDDKYLISKEIAEKILRQDIRRFIKNKL
ncbi:MAG: hypothetical protein C0448_14505 [Sphingobacteriaceae bacterium]|nr:hypothetical protein [Sphingobacteriaceae bacterium]